MFCFHHMVVWSNYGFFILYTMIVLSVKNIFSHLCDEIICKSTHNVVYPKQLACTVPMIKLRSIYPSKACSLQLYTVQVCMQPSWESSWQMVKIKLQRHLSTVLCLSMSSLNWIIYPKINWRRWVAKFVFTAYFLSI